MAQDRLVVDPDEVMERVDENTIGVIPILGTTYTGEFEPVKEIHDRAVDFNAEHDLDVPIHVDPASGGFVAPNIYSELEWDFRLPQVKSINVSSHKYGLTYPAIGFVVWRSQEDLREDLIFRVNYLGSTFFMLSALSAFTLPITGEILNLTLVNSGTFIGAVCFFIGAHLLLPPQVPTSREICHG